MPAFLPPQPCPGNVNTPIIPFASRQTIWLPQLLPPATFLLTGKGEDHPPDVAASPPPAQQGSPKAVASGPDPDWLPIQLPPALGNAQPMRMAAT